ncbi:MAG: CRTAC1 family protein [Phycisphaerae bacterium]
MTLKTLSILLIAAAILVAGTLWLQRRPSPLTEPAARSNASTIQTHLRFVDGVARTGLRFTHHASRSPARHMPDIMGGGVIIADFNRDAAPDVLFVDSGNLTGPVPADAGNRLYLGDGHGAFRDATQAWGLTSARYGMGGAAGDFDNDGWTDVYLTSYFGDDRLLRNTGNGFVDVTQKAGIPTGRGWSTSAGFLDMDGDGDLDLYVVRYVDYALDRAIKCYSAGYHVYCTPILYDAVPDSLLQNNGDGTYTDVSDRLASPAQSGKGLALAIGDLDNDGDQDVYVANDTAANALFLSDGRGGFTERGMYAGVAYSEVGAEEGSMGADFSDVNGDQMWDIICTNFQSESNALYVQGEPFFFRESSDAVGLGATARKRLAFGVDFFDADNDGDEDLLVANGHIEDNIAQYNQGTAFAQPDTLYECLDLDTARFLDVTDAAGALIGAPAVSRGLATGDLDGDGDLDYVITVNDGPAIIGLNETERTGHFISFWLEGASNRSAIGARIVLRIGDRIIVRQVMGASSYLSQSDRRLHFGLGDPDRIDEITVFWPGGSVQHLENAALLQVDTFYHWPQGRLPVRVIPGAATITP